MGALNEFVFMVLLLIRTKICCPFLGLRQTNGFSSLGPRVPKRILFAWPSNKSGKLGQVV